MNINDMGYDLLVSDPSTYVKKRTKRQYDSINSILLRHMDDVIGTAPEEHMNTSLYLTMWWCCATKEIQSILGVFMAPWKADMHFASHTAVHTSAQSNNRKQTCSETVASICQSKVHATPLFVSNHSCQLKKRMIELVGRSDADWTGDS